MRNLTSKTRFLFLVAALIVLYSMVIFNGSQPVQAANQAQITAAMGAGWNLGNQLEANINGTPSETAWGNPTITQALITAVKNAGFKTIRIPVSLLSKIGPAPNYTIDAAWMARVKQVVDYAYNQNLYVILDAVHGDGYKTVTGGWLLVTASDQATIRAKYKAVWQQIANTFKDYDERLIFESMNEVFDGDWNDPEPAHYANLNAYNQIFVDTVRQTGGNNATRWLLIPGWNTDINYTARDYGFVIPTDNYRSSSIPGSEKRLMISVHYYSPWDFCGEENGNKTQWGAIATNPAKVSSWGQEDFMERELAEMYYKFVTKGYPVVVGEWGVVDKTRDDSASNTYRQYFAKTLCTYCKKYGAVPVYWDNGWNGDYGFGIFNRNTYAATQQGIINAIMSGINANVTSPPPPSPTPTPTPPGPGANITVLYKCNNTNASTNAINPSFQVRNDDTIPIPLSSIKIRYWYTRDGGEGQVFTCDYAQMGSQYITGTCVRIPISEQTGTADYYVEVGFTSEAGSLNPGQSTGEIQIRINQWNWSSYTQTNDYSFNPNMTAFGQNSKVTGYVNRSLEFGTEPGGSTPPPVTPTNTATASIIPTPTNTPTASIVPTSTNTPTASIVPTPTNTPTASIIPTPTNTPTASIVPTPTNTATASIIPTPTNTPTASIIPTPTQSPAGGYVVEYDNMNDWGSGATINVIITNNTATPVNGWTLVFTFPGNQQINHMWGGTYTQNGANVTVQNVDWTNVIGANGGSVIIGFNLTYSGTNYEPASFTLNGVPCQVR